jgi:cytochrome c oxidase subunit 2
MRGRVIVEERADYEAWVASQPTYGEIRARPPGDAVAGAAAYAVCAACHGQQAEGNLALNAPKLSGQDARYLKNQLKKYKAGVRGTHEADLFGKQMQPMAATLVNDAMIDNVLAYIGTLPDNPTPTTVSGDIAHGAKLYADCANCHGSAGQGVKMNAPRVAGISDWYLLNQLKNFKGGVRGDHPADMHGKQMAFMARMLQDDQAMQDVIAYINTL